ncbi:hypothetical protein [uncultured Flavobacterium sp.]|uniref:hypothetical protein n=1 Tax=uncultured Flavobacterium sp. TaxID=165435 RepID=UPI0025968B8E|nr:hypothetical protein [uncultured Flavobacterium sp.]
MMAFASLEDVIPQILKNIDFHQYLLDNGYKLLPNKNVKGFKCYAKQSSLILEDDIVFVGHSKGVDIYYSSLFSDSGNIIDFVKNRFELENDYTVFTPVKNHFIEAVRRLVLYINENGENEVKNDLGTTAEDLKNLKQNTFTTFYKCEPLFDAKYLESFKISKSVYDHPIFKGTIYNSRGLIFNEEQLDIINTAFPLFNESGKECGLYFENKIEKNKRVEGDIHFFAKGSVETGLWFSNNYLLDKNIKKVNFKTKVTVVNNPKDALAHFSHLRENRFYVSIFKQDETTYEHLKSVLTRQRSNLYLAGNVTILNFVNEIKLILQMLTAEIEFVKENNETITLKINAEKEGKHLDKLLKLIRKNNTSKIELVLKTLGDVAKPILQNDLIIPAEDNSGNLLIRIPKNFATLFFVEQILIKCFPAPFDIYIEKPQYLDWTKQNIKITTAVEDTTSSEDIIEKYIQEEKIFVLSN